MTTNLKKLAASLDLEFRGDVDTVISGVASLKSAKYGDLCFVQQRKYLAELEISQCGAVIVPPELITDVSGKALLVSDNPQYSFSKAIEVLGLGLDGEFDGIHPSAQIAISAKLGENLSIGAMSVIQEGVMIGDGCVLGAGVVVEKRARIGNDCRIHNRVTVNGGVSVGDRCVLHPGAVIGADGFGLIMHEEKWHKIPHLGSVAIADDVEIGANTTIDRGALDDTVIEQGCKLDNQIQVAHNVRIGAHTAIAACVGIAGSANIGRHCKISGAAVVLGHLSVADHVTITAMSLVTKDIKIPGVYSSGTPLLENHQWHRCNVRYKSLDELAQSVSLLEKSIKGMPD